MRSRQREDGTATLEMTFVFALVILPLILGILQYGYWYWSLQTAKAAAVEAARRLAVGTDPCEVRSDALLQADSPAVSEVRVGYSVPYTATSQPSVGTPVTVTVTFETLHIPFIPVPSSAVVTQSATNVIQTRRHGTATDPFLALDGSRQPGAARQYFDNSAGNNQNPCHAVP